MVEDRHKASHGKSLSGADAAHDFITIAKVIKTQGRQGEVAAMLYTDFPERFATRRRLLLLDAKDQRQEMEIENHWFHKGQVVLKFKGVDSINDAEMLIGCEVQVPRADRSQLEADEVYVSDLVGCAVYDTGREIGRIHDVQFGAGEAPLLVVRGEKEYLVPFVTEYIENIALQQQRVEMKLPPGMLELDAPLTAEEKQRQSKSG